MAKPTHLLIATAAVEGGAGLALAIAPSALASILLGTTLDTPAALVVARIAGAALVSLGAACWLARKDEQSRAARGLIAAMLIYNVAAIAVFAYARIRFGLCGVGLWPAVLTHVILGVWCLACLRARANAGDSK